MERIGRRLEIVSHYPAIQRGRALPVFAGVARANQLPLGIFDRLGDSLPLVQ